MATDECPRTAITAESLRLMETYQAWKTLGGGDTRRLPAREVDALITLEAEMRAERNDEQQ